MLHSTFSCFILFTFANVVASEKRCEYLGKSYLDEQKFDFGCQERCTCSKGKVTCISKCPPEASPDGNGEKCRKVLNVEDCCGHLVCKEEMEKEKCDTVARLDETRAPWLVRFISRNNEVKKHCTGTITGKQEVTTTEDCIAPGGTITFTYPAATSRWQMPPQPISRDLINGSRVSFIHPSPLEFSALLHEVNRPAGHGDFCDDTTCALYLTTFDPLTNRTQYVPARSVEKRYCQIPWSDRWIYCMKPDYTTKPSCTNFDGSSVLVRKGDSFYIVGVLVDEDKAKNNRCDNDWPIYRKFQRRC